MAEELEGPESVAGPPVRLVAVENDGGVVGDPGTLADLGEFVGVDVVADELVLEVADPVDLDGARDVAHVVQEDVFIALDDPYLGVVGMLLDPVSGDEGFGVNIFSH